MPLLKPLLDRAGTQIFVADATGANITQLTFRDEYHNAPAWSPDGQRLAFNSSSGLTIMNLTDRTVFYPADPDWNVVYPTWSPNGSKVVVTAFIIGAIETTGGLYTIEVESGDMTRISQGSDSQPDWSPDGKRIAFLHSEIGISSSPTLRVIDPDGSNPVDIVPPEYDPYSPKRLMHIPP